MPLHPRYSTYESRVESFKNPFWPSYCPVTPEDLAAAGLYYFGMCDAEETVIDWFN